jgi:hypothetical protein
MHSFYFAFEINKYPRNTFQLRTLSIMSIPNYIVTRVDCLEAENKDEYDAYSVYLMKMKMQRTIQAK